MDNIQVKMELDSDNNESVFLRESDPFLPIPPSPEEEKQILDEILENGIKTPPSSPTNSHHSFLSDDRWLFSPPPVVRTESEILNNIKTEKDIKHCEENSKTLKKGKERKSSALRKRANRPTSLVLPSRENSPNKRIKPNTVATLLETQSIEKPDTPIPTDITHFGIHPVLLLEPVLGKPPSLLHIVSHPTPELVRKLTNSRISYVNPPVCRRNKK